jgi:hypothetical protein
MKNDFSFLPKGSDLEELVERFNTAVENMNILLDEEIANLRKLYNLGKSEKVDIDKKLLYREEVIRIVKPFIRAYSNDVRTRFSKERNKFISKDCSARRKNLSAEDVNATFYIRKGNSHIICLSNRIKQLPRWAQKQSYKSVLHAGIQKNCRNNDSLSLIDDCVISDMMGCMAVIDPKYDLNSVTNPYYSIPHWITVEDSCLSYAEGHTRQTKMIHSAEAVVLDFHERDPRSLFFCHFGPNSQDVYERRKLHKLSPKPRDIVGIYSRKLYEFFSKGFNFQKMY